ncbi:MAG TPA: hypothetical protein VFX98_18055 [Longimicrobiaceae bacterium]|nr:hypothetical protein [Longimicrobiaceae bacterium]
MTAAPSVILPLLEDGSLALAVEPELVPLLHRWLPLLPFPEPPSLPAGAAVARLARGPHAAFVSPDTPPVLRLGSVDVWVDAAAERALLLGRAGCRGEVRLPALQAELAVPRGDDESAAAELFPLLTLATALLLGRMHRALVHAAAVVAPGGGCWLLVGDTHAGKSTTCANLLAAGWSYLSDDHVVLGRDGEGRLRVEGWPRPFHLDVGWEAGAPAGTRGETDPRERWPGRWRRSAPLAGLLFPRVVPAEPTAREPMAAAAALSALMRQSPWLLADRGCAAEVLALLGAAAALPAHALRLGLDSYADPALLAGRLAPD